MNRADLLGPDELRRATLWFPVFMAIGIAVYFGLAWEPSVTWCGVLGLPLLFLLSGFARKSGLAIYLTVWACLGIGVGFASSYVHTHLSGVRMLEFPVTETVEGRVVSVSRSASGAARVVLDRVHIYGVEPGGLPSSVRISLTGEDPAPVPGTRIRLYARLSAPEGPVEPGGYDFRRQAYFSGLGAIGYALGIAIPVQSHENETMVERLELGIAHLRFRASRYLRAVLPGDEGAFAAAIIVGDRSHIDEADSEALRAANLSHLLAISGLHMGILTGLVFGGLRLILSGIGWIALRYPTKKIAAICALIAAAGYLAFSGATVATQRAFIMVAVALVAVLFDRRAITLRAVAVAATIVLVLRPISLLEPGFQMSFAATTALVAGYGAIRNWMTSREQERTRADITVQRQILKRILVYGGGLILTSILAGLATAPFAAYHFNRSAPYGLIANLVAVPAMGLVVAPSAIMAGLAAPFGFAAPLLKLMGMGVAAILDVAHEVSSWPGAVRATTTLPVWTIIAFSCGALWLCLWQGRWRLFGVIGPLIAILAWNIPGQRPELLVAPGGRLLGLMGPDGRSLDHPASANFIAKSWLRRDGDLSDQSEAYARQGIDHAGKHSVATLPNGWRVIVVRKKIVDQQNLRANCTPRTLFLVFRGQGPSGPCMVLAGRSLSDMGAIAIKPDGKSILIKPSRAVSDRPWMGSTRRDQ